jgi:hypothetical protein
MRIQLDREAREALVKLCDRTGMTQIAVMSRVMSWFSKQNEVIQARVLGGLSDETVADLAKQMLQKMASGQLDSSGRIPVNLNKK